MAKASAIVFAAVAGVEYGFVAFAAASSTYMSPFQSVVKESVAVAAERMRPPSMVAVARANHWYVTP